MPEHSMYVEVFGGGLNVLYAKEPINQVPGHKCKTKHCLEVVNDINEELINLHRQIQKHPQTLSYYLNNLLISRKAFNAIKSGAYKPRNDIQRGAYYFYLLSQSFGSKGNHFAMSAKSGRKPKNIYRDFKVYSNRLKFVTIEQMAFDELITKYDKVQTLFYLDPPYVGTESYYSNTSGFGKKEHERLAFMLKNIKGKFMLSYNDCDYIRELYKNFNIKEVQTNYLLSKNSRGKVVKELIIYNF